MAAARTTRSRAKATEQIRLEGKLDLAASERLAEALRAVRGKPVAIDASGVTTLGAHAVQTLLVGAASWRGDGRSFRLGGLPDAAVDQLRVLGLTPEAFSTEEETL